MFLGCRASAVEDPTPPASDTAPAQAEPPVADQRPAEPQPPVEEPAALDAQQDGKDGKDKALKADEEKAKRVKKAREDAPPVSPAKPAGSESRPDKENKEKTADGQPDRVTPAKRTEDKDRSNRPLGQNSKEATATPPALAPEQQQAENQVRETTREVERSLNERKTKIRDRSEAQAVIDEVLGAESRISKAEIDRESHARSGAEPSRERDRQSAASPEQRREVANYFRQRLRGEKSEVAPPILRTSEARRRDTGERVEETRREGRVDDHGDDRRPRYLNEGRRYVHFSSRASVPAILLAAEALNRVRFQPVREVASIFYGRETVTETYAVAPPPENYRSGEALVLSYPVDENSMISSENIWFLQGSTQFSDPLSYDIISSLADAIRELPSDQRFVVEGHASAEGSYEDNSILSQQRAERIVREIVRRGVQPSRMLPVGYGESEARYPADADEALRRQDRRVVVFRLKEEPTASR